MAYSWDNRVKYVVRYMYDIDNNGFLDKNDFECLALRNTLIEGRGEFNEAAYANNQKIMSNLWNEIAELADFNKDGEVSDDEFKQAVKTHCSGKVFESFPPAFKSFISAQFKTIDVNGTLPAFFTEDGEVTIDEFKKAVQNVCVGKAFATFPAAFKVFIANQFKTVDVNGDGLVGVDEYRLDCISRSAFANIKEIDDAYNKLATDEDKKAGGISLARYQELYAQFISNPDESANAVYLFGPLKEVQ